MIKLFDNFSTDIERILHGFGVSVVKAEKHKKSNFDIYDLTLSSGTKISKIEGLLPELGLSLKSKSIPRGYSVWDKGVYRIEVQNSPLKSYDVSGYFSEFENKFCPIVLGSDIYGNKICPDLSDFPNLLIGGATGSGKSVVLHNVIISLIKNNAEIYLVDPKMVEFSAYEECENIKRIIYSIDEAESIIQSAKEEMNRRFALLRKSKSRNVKEYNLKSSEKMKPYVLVIDEWADLILEDKKIEKPLCQVAQKGRAAGMCIVLATQRPSSKVISGLIKANFLGRVCMRVSNSTNSRIILDSSGGEKITEKGMGIFKNKDSKYITFKSPYVEDIEGFLEENFGVIYDS